MAKKIAINKVVSVSMLLLCITCLSFAVFSFCSSVNYTNAGTNTYKLAMCFCGPDGVQYNCGIDLQTTDPYAQITCKEIMNYLNYGSTTATKGTISKLQDDDDDDEDDVAQFKELFKGTGATITGAYCYDQDNNKYLKIGYYGYEDVISFSTWTWLSDGKVVLEYTDYFGVQYKCGNTSGKVSFSYGTFRDEDTSSTKNVNIKNYTDFAKFRDLVNFGYTYSGCTFTLNTDITISSEYWEPIGYVKNKLGEDMDNIPMFSGTFDGNNHYITYTSTFKGMRETNNYKDGHDDIDEPIGLFGQVRNATIKNLWLKNCKIDWSETTTYFTDSCGLLVGYASNLLLSNIKVTGGVVMSKDVGYKGSSSAGGVIGVLLGGATISDLYVQADVTVQCQDDANFINAGGVVGYIGDTSGYNFSRCIFIGKTVVQTNYYDGKNSADDKYGSVNYATCGGIVGASDPNKITASSSAPKVSFSGCLVNLNGDSKTSVENITADKAKSCNIMYGGKLCEFVKDFNYNVAVGSGITVNLIVYAILRDINTEYVFGASESDVTVTNCYDISVYKPPFNQTEGTAS